MQTKKATSEPTRVFATPIDYQSFQKSVKINKKKLVKISGWEQVNNFEKVLNILSKKLTDYHNTLFFYNHEHTYTPQKGTF